MSGRVSGSRAARLAARLLGAAAARFDRGAVNAATRALAAALPELDAGERRRLARRARARRLEARLETRRLAALDAVRFCRRLRLEGWHHLDTEEGGPILVTAPVGSPAAARRALEIYRRPLTVLGEPAAGAASPPAGGTVLGLADAPGEHGEVPFLGGRLAIALAPFALAAGRGTAPLPVFGRAAGSGWTVRVEPPLAGAGGGPESLAGLFAARLEAAVRADPAAWPWDDPRWCPR